MFWLYLISPTVGAVGKSTILVLLAWGALGAIVRQDRVSVDIWAPALAVAAIGLVVTLATHLGGDADVLRVAVTRWMSMDLPGDNQPPFLSAEALREGSLPRPLHADWLTNERPPLQTGLVPLFSTPRWHDALAYQTVSVCLQMFALAGVWAMARGLSASVGVAALAMLAVAASPLAIIHGAYVWPKMLAGGFLAVTATIYFTERYEWSRGQASVGALAGAAAACAMLSHGAVGFAIIGLVVTALVLRRIASARFIAAGLTAFFLIYAPWIGYQKFVDPPGDRLAKWHLAGVVPIDDRTLGEALIDSYADLSLTEWAAGRMVIARVLVGRPFEKWGRLGADAREAFQTGDRNVMREARTQTFVDVTLALGPVALFALFLAFLAFWSTFRPLIVAGLAGYGLWVPLLFEPGQTIVHQGAYWPFLATVTLIVAAIGARSARLAAVLVMLHCVVVVTLFSL